MNDKGNRAFYQGLKIYAISKVNRIVYQQNIYIREQANLIPEAQTQYFFNLYSFMIYVDVSYASVFSHV